MGIVVKCSLDEKHCDLCRETHVDHSPITRFAFVWLGYIGLLLVSIAVHTC